MGMPVKHWSLWGSFNIEAHAPISQEDFIVLCNESLMFMDIKPHLFAEYILKDLREHGYYVLIVTAREGFVNNAYDMTKEYLSMHNFEYDNLLISKSGGNKMEVLGDYDLIEFSLDDQVHNCDIFAASGKINKVLLAAEAHNKNCTVYPRLHNLYQVYNYIGLN